MSTAVGEAATLQDALWRLSPAEVKKVATGLKTSDLRNAAMVKATEALQAGGQDWRKVVKDAQASATHAYFRGDRDPLVHTWLHAAAQAAALAVAAREHLTDEEYRVLVEPVAAAVPGLAEGKIRLGVPAPSPDEPPKKKQEEPPMATATKPKKAGAPKGIVRPKDAKTPAPKPERAPRAGKPATEGKPAPKTEGASAEHAITKHEALAREKGVKLARNPHGGYHVTIPGTLFRALSGVWSDAKEMKAAVEAAGFNIVAVGKGIEL